MPAHRPGWDHDAAPYAVCSAFRAGGRSAGQARDAAGGQDVPELALRWPPDEFGPRRAGALQAPAPIAPAARRRGIQAAAHWRGAGGRWLVWVGRVVVWAVLLLVGYRGVAAIAGSPAAAGNRSGSGRPASATRFPVTAAEAYALEFGNAYLNFSPATATARSLALAAFLPPGVDPQLGWNGAGTQQLLAEQVDGIAVRNKHTAVVTLLALLAGGSLVELGVPIYASGSRMSVSGEPALLSGPAKAVAPAAGQRSGDKATEAALQSQLAGFFQAYASGDEATLARFVIPRAQITGLAGTVRFGAVDAVYAPAGNSTRTISVTVTWLLPSQPAPRSSVATASVPAGLQMSYQVTVVLRGSSWDVRSIGATAPPLARGPP